MNGWRLARTRWHAAAMVALMCGGALAAGPAAEPELGVAGIRVDMSPDQVSAALSQQKQRIFSSGPRYVEAIVSDPHIAGSVRARFLFGESGTPHIHSVEFVADDDQAMHQYIAWYAKLTSQYGPASPQIDGDSLRSTFCHSADIAVVLALFDHRTVLAYLYGLPGAAACQKSGARHGFAAVAYDWRPADAPPPPVATPTPTPEPAPGNTAATPPATASAGRPHPSPLAYAPRRSQRYQDTLRCIGIAAWHAADGDPRWKGVVQNLSRTLVGIGQSEGVPMQQVDTEGHQIVGANVRVYQEGRKDDSGQAYGDLDQAYCRSLGLIPG